MLSSCYLYIFTLCFLDEHSPRVSTKRIIMQQCTLFTACKVALPLLQTGRVGKIDERHVLIWASEHTLVVGMQLRQQCLSRKGSWPGGQLGGRTGRRAMQYRLCCVVHRQEGHPLIIVLGSSPARRLHTLGMLVQVAKEDTGVATVAAGIAVAQNKQTRKRRTAVCSILSAISNLK